MKKLTVMLMASIVVGLCMGVVSCKDDDDDENDNRQIGGGSEMNANANDDAAVLTSLLGKICEYESESIDPTILNKTFEPTLGTVDDESQSTVRTIVAGTVASADTLATVILSSLGMNIDKANGFNYSNNAIGTVSYQHSSGSELAIINFDVKQIPHLSKIVFTATPKDNALTETFYDIGDVVRYKNKAYVCVSSLGKSKPMLNWVHFDTMEDLREKRLSINTCKWLYTGNDVYYSGNMADRDILGDWIENILLNENVYNKLQESLMSDLTVLANEIREVIPYDKGERDAFIQRCLIKDANSVVYEAWKTVGKEKSPRFLLDKPNVEVGEQGNNWRIMIYNVRSLLLCNTMRWSGIVSSHNYWVPYVCLVEDGEAANELSKQLDNTPSMKTLSPSHFEWQVDKSVTYNDKKYWIYDLAIHWTHDTYTLPDNTAFKYYGLIDFTNFIDFDTYWSGRNITSCSMSFCDTGKAKKGMVLIGSATKTVGYVTRQ